MKRKLILSTFSLFLLTILTIFTYNLYLSYQPGSEDEYNNSINYLNKDVDFKLLIYGDDIAFPGDIHYTKITSLEDEPYNHNNDYVYLIINDLSGKLSITEEQIQTLVNYADKNTNLNFHYIGTAAFPYFKKNVIDCDLDESNMSFGSVLYNGDRLQDYGLWHANDNVHYQGNKDLLGQCIITNILQNIQSNES